jgi:sugar/nucleoside kinase (ribokinase family)
MAELFRFAKEAGLSTSLDTNDDPDGLWGKDVLEVLAWVDVLLPNEREACCLAGVEQPEQALDVLSRLVPLVVLKRGEKGAIACCGKQSYKVAARGTRAVDTIGAGDSFDAGFLHQFIRGEEIEECLRFGNLTGALSTTRPGGTEAFRDEAHRKAFLAS